MVGSGAVLAVACGVAADGRNGAVEAAKVVEIILRRETAGKVVLVSESGMIRAPYSLNCGQAG